MPRFWTLLQEQLLAPFFCFQARRAGGWWWWWLGGGWQLLAPFCSLQAAGRRQRWRWHQAAVFVAVGTGGWGGVGCVGGSRGLLLLLPAGHR